MLQRRGLLLGLLAAPAIIRTPGLLMSVRPVPVVHAEVWTVLLQGRVAERAVFRGALTPNRAVQLCNYFEVKYGRDLAIVLERRPLFLSEGYRHLT